MQTNKTRLKVLFDIAEVLNKITVYHSPTEVKTILTNSLHLFESYPGNKTTKKPRIKADQYTESAKDKIILILSLEYEKEPLQFEIQAFIKMAIRELIKQ